MFWGFFYIYIWGNYWGNLGFISNMLLSLSDLLAQNWLTCEMKHYRRYFKRLMCLHQIGLTWRINRPSRDFRRPFWTCWGRCVSCSIRRIRSTSLVSWDAWRSWGRSATTTQRCSHPGEWTTTNLPRCSVRSGTCSDTQEVKDDNMNISTCETRSWFSRSVYLYGWFKSPHDPTSGSAMCWLCEGFMLLLVFILLA